MKIIFLAMPRIAIHITCKSMYTGMLLAFELYKAKRDDLLKRAAEHRLARASRRESSGLAPVLETLPAEGYPDRA